MHQPTVDLLTNFYNAFNRHDPEVMAQSYAPDVVFSDPVFQTLRGSEPGDMWRMLAGRSKDLKIEFSVLEATPDSGKVHWDAHYTFAATGRKVLNRIDASFKLKDGKIIEHHDMFDLWAWTRMALGTSGILLGWSPLVQNKVRATAANGLKDFRAKKGAT
jgi:limonene-1,2-epoxide hydrolase